MPADKSFTLDSRTSSGNINCDFKLEDKVSDDNTLKGIYLNGDILLNIKTSSGNIDIERQ